jgi:hypothetical protein
VVEDALGEIQLDYKDVLRYSMKFIRILNTGIVDICTLHNLENRVTFRGIPAKMFGNVKEGDLFRIINWSATTDNRDVAKIFSGAGEIKDSTIVKLNIPEGCWNAGRL